MQNHDFLKIKALLKAGKITREELDDAWRNLNDGHLVRFEEANAEEIVLFANHNQMICWAEEIRIAANSLYKKLADENLIGEN